MLTDEQKHLVSQKIQAMYLAFEKQPIHEGKLDVYLDYLSKTLPNLKDPSFHFQALMAACTHATAYGYAFPLIRDLARDWVPPEFKRYTVEL